MVRWENIAGTVLLMVVVGATVLYYDLMKSLLLEFLKNTRWFMNAQKLLTSQPLLLVIILFAVTALLAYVVQNLRR